ncbi:MAG: RagB/SusD family nutrient uptake outer membrane protein [Gemmatimonadetes bacterium]|nr:RagB/SusD family nutrient uptake outer membrane protein [Gemmatimonadota bacterium]
MTRAIGRARGARLAGGLVSVLVLIVVAGCSGLVDVDDSAIILPSEIDAAGPAAVPSIIFGMVGSYHEITDDITLITALLTDEMISASTFPDRLQVDDRKIPPNNLELSGLYSGIHHARFQADTIVSQFQRKLTGPAFKDVVDELSEGIALGQLIGGYSRIWLSELYCWSILTGMASEQAPLLPDTRMQQAVTFLQQAEARAATIGAEDIRLAAIVGQARAQLWLRNYAQASALAAQVPRSFAYDAEYSNNDHAQYNEMYVFTWGDTQPIHWTVGDGTDALRGSERWEHLTQFKGLNLLLDRPAGKSSQSGTEVVLQTQYSRAETSILMASGMEATLIRAEAAVRSGQAQVARDLLNGLRADYSLRATIRWGVPPPTAQNALQPIQLSGNVQANVKRVADERARELWLTGDRLTTSRRLRLDPTVSINLFPPVKTVLGGGDDIALPITQDELDRNPNVSRACPTGQGAGSWR